MKKLIFIITFMLTMLISVSFAGENLTYTNFEKLVKEKGLSLPADFSPDENLIAILQENPVIIENNGKIYIYGTKGILDTSHENDYDFGFGVGGSGDYRSYLFGVKYKGNHSVEPFSRNSKVISRDYDLKSYILNLKSGSGDYLTYSTTEHKNVGSYYTRIFNYFSSAGKSYNNDDDVIDNKGPACFGLTINTLSETVEDFKKPKKIKSFIDDHLIFNGYGPLYYYYDNALVDVSYFFDGVFLGRHSEGATMLPNGVFKLIESEGENIGFSYKPLNFDYADVAHFQLQEVPVECVPTIDSDDFYVEGKGQQGCQELSTDLDLYSKTFYFRDLKKLMEEEKIYRLICTSTFKGLTDSGDSVNNIYYDTTCFFSLNDWDSEYIKVLNISELDNEEKPPVPLPNPESSGDVDIGGYIDSVNDTIEDTILGTEDEDGNRKGGLLGGLIDFFTNLLKDFWAGVVNLIIPTTEQFGEWITKTYEDVNKTGGILLYSKQFWLALLGLVNNDTPKDLIFNIPQIKSPLTNQVIYEGIEFNMTQFVNEHEAFKTMYTIYIVIISGLAIFEFCKFLWSLWEHIINGTGSVEVSQEEGFVSTQEGQGYITQHAKGNPVRKTYVKFK